MQDVNTALRERFERVANERHWSQGQSVSGPGSERGSYWVAEAIAALRETRNRTSFRAIADIPCGDFNWMSDFLESEPAILYHGFDIVPSIIHRNQQLYPSYQFDTLDITSAVPPRADLIFSKDLFNHLTYADVNMALDNMKRSGASFLLASNNFGYGNTELPEGHDSGSRHLDICAAPFNFHTPIWRTEYLGLWLLPGIPG